MKEFETNLAIIVENVSKRIGKRIVLDKVSLQVPVGQIYGIRGPNGAGKSMLLKVISGLVRPSEGEVIAFGERIGQDVEFPKQTGILIERPGFLPHYSALKNLELLASIRNRVTRDDIAATLYRVELNPEDARPVKTYSTGMLQRLGIAQALMEKPRLLLLDEPTNSLDRKGITDIHDLLKNLRAEGVTILLTSHSSEELKNLCDAILWMERGHLESYAFPQP